MSNLFKISIYIFELIYLINISVALPSRTDNNDVFAGIDLFREKQLKSLTNAEKEYLLDKAKITHYDRSNFTHLISGGYRLQDNVLTKYAVSIRSITVTQYFGDNHFCAGIIIKPWAVLTAAHCCKAKVGYLQSWEVIVVTGAQFRLQRTENTRLHYVKSIRIHPEYNHANIKNDIAIFILKKPYIVESEYAQCAPLANSPPRPFQKCTVIGWGRLYNNGPLANEITCVDVRIWNDTMCQKAISIYKPGMLCASSFIDPDRDACSGDSGGPMFCNGFLSGIVSFGWGCGVVGLPGIYTNVWEYRQWVARNNVNKLTAPSHFLVSILFIWYVFRIVVNIVIKIK